MMYYEKPMLVIISFNTADMITTSLGGDDNGLIQDGGGWNIGGKNGSNGFEFESF